MISLKIFSFLFAISLLALVHEFGHFIVARLFNVRVERFSIGLGKKVFGWINKKSGTEYMISLFPLGGYVKFMEDEEDVKNPKSEEQKQYFSGVPFESVARWKKLLIIIAGPMMNAIFGILLFAMAFTMGVQYPAAIVGKVVNNTQSIGKFVKADRIINIANRTTKGWGDVVMTFLTKIGSDDIPVNILRSKNTKSYAIDLSSLKLDKFNPDILHSIGLVPYKPSVRAEVWEISFRGPAAKAGILKGDKILKIDNKKYKDWDEMIEFVKKHPNVVANFSIERGRDAKKQNLIIPVKIGKRFGSGGYLGVAAKAPTWPAEALITEKYPLLESFKPALCKSYDLMEFNVIMICKMISGKMSFHVLGGPISIFQSAAYAMERGAKVYIEFLALLSIILAIMNILPIPALDGSYVLFILIESIFRRDIPIKIKELIMKIGLIALICIIAGSLFNDTIRLLISK